MLDTLLRSFFPQLTATSRRSWLPGLILIAALLSLSHLPGRPALSQTTILTPTQRTCDALQFMDEAFDQPPLPCLAEDMIAQQVSGSRVALPSSKPPKRFEVEGIIHYRGYQSPVLTFLVDDCLDAMNVNDQPVKLPPPPRGNCRREVTIDLTSELQSGDNLLRLQARDLGGRFGYEFRSRPSAIKIVAQSLLVTWLALWLFGPTSAYLAWAIPTGWQTLRTFLTSLRDPFPVIIGPVVVVMGLVGHEWLMGHRLKPTFPFELLPVVAAVTLWARTARISLPRPWTIQTHLVIPIVFLLVLAANLAEMGKTVVLLRKALYTTAMILSLLVLGAGPTILRAIRQDLRLFLIALIAATPIILYRFLNDRLWPFLCHHTAATIASTLDLIGFPVRFRSHASDFIISTKVFGVHVFPACSGLEGVFLLILILSIVLLADWAHFARRSMTLLFVGGIAGMLLMNVIRIGSLFLVGHMAYHPEASAWQRSLRGVPVDAFHSYSGWIYYIVAILVYLAILYRPTSRPGVRQR